MFRVRALPCVLALCMGLLSACLDDENAEDEPSALSSGLCACGPALRITVTDADTGARVPFATVTGDGLGTCTTGELGTLPCELGGGEGSYLLSASAPGYDDVEVGAVVDTIDVLDCPCSHLTTNLDIEMFSVAGGD